MSQESPLMIPDLLRMVQQFAYGNELQITEVILVQRNGKQICLEVPTIPIVPAGQREASQEEERQQGPSQKLMGKVLSVLPDPDREPMPAKVVWKLTGYSSKSDVYKALRFLIESGQAARVNGKYRKARQSTTADVDDEDDLDEL